MKWKITGIFILCFMMGFCACGGVEEGDNNDSQLNIQIQTEAQQYVLDDGVTPGLDFEVQKPVVKISENEMATQAINESLELLNENFLSGKDYYMSRDGLMEEAQEDFLEQKELGMEDYFNGYYLHRTVTVAFSEKPVLSFVYEDTSYTGGAHGLTERTGVNYDLQTGEKLTLQDIVTDETEFESFFNEKILELSQSDFYKNEDESIFFEDYVENIPLLMGDGQWYFSDSGLVFIANEYLLAPYAAGIIEFVIPYEDLKGLLQEKYQLD